MIIDQEFDSLKDRNEENKLEIKEKIFILKYDIPQKTIYERKEEIPNPLIADPNAATNSSKQIPDECICSSCKYFLIKPYILSCCCQSICKFCKICKFDLSKNETCLFCGSSDFEISPNAQAHLAMKTMFGLKDSDPLKNDSEKVNKFQIWKQLNDIFYDKISLQKTEIQVKNDEKDKILQWWMRHLMVSKISIVKIPDLKSKVDKTKIKLPKHIATSETLSDAPGGNMLILTEDYSKMYGLVVLGKEVRRDSRRSRDRDRDRDRDSREYKCTWKIIWEVPQEREIAEDIERISTKQAIDIVIDMIKDEIEQEKLLLDEQLSEDSFYKYAKEKLIDNNSWLGSQKAKNDPQESIKKSEEAVIIDERDTNAIVSPSHPADLSIHKKSSNNDDSSFYDNIPVERDTQGQAQSTRESKDSKSSRQGNPFCFINREIENESKPSHDDVPHVSDAKWLL